MEPLTLSVADTDKTLNLGVSTVYKMIRADRLETVKIGARTLVKTASIHRLLEAA